LFASAAVTGQTRNLPRRIGGGLSGSERSFASLSLTSFGFLLSKFRPSTSRHSEPSLLLLSCRHGNMCSRISGGGQMTLHTSQSWGMSTLSDSILSTTSTLVPTVLIIGAICMWYFRRLNPMVLSALITERFSHGVGSSCTSKGFY
jgi:hypothetical protein